MDRCDRELAAQHALAGLTPSQSRTFTRHLTRCPACRVEINRLLDVAASLALALPPVDPPARLRERILAAAWSAGS